VKTVPSTISYMTCREADIAGAAAAGRNGTLSHSFDTVRGPMLANPRGVSPTTARPIGRQTAIFTDKAARVFDQNLTGVKVL
jgi:hypothetical protein